MNNTGFIVIIAYPDTIVRVANGEKISKIWPLLGVGGKNKVQAGHAALLLVDKKSNAIDYFDFGRYITSDKFGRVRSKATDYEVEVPMEAIHDGHEIKNLKEILLYLEKSPEKTHGEGRMIVSVNHKIDYLKAREFIDKMQSRNQIPYGAFLKHGSNCARFVTDTIIVASNDRKITKKLKRTTYLTPSPISNVINGVALDSSFYQVFQQKVEVYANRSIAKEHWQCFFKRIPQDLDEVGTVYPNTNKYNSVSGQWLGGIGSGAWFELEEAKEKNDLEYRIVRRNVDGEIDMDSIFEVKGQGFTLHKNYTFMHGSNGKKCLVSQENKLYEFFFRRKN